MIVPITDLLGTTVRSHDLINYAKHIYNGFKVSLPMLPRVSMCVLVSRSPSFVP